MAALSQRGSLSRNSNTGSSYLALGGVTVDGPWGAGGLEFAGCCVEADEATEATAATGLEMSAVARSLETARVGPDGFPAQPLARMTTPSKPSAPRLERRVEMAKTLSWASRWARSVCPAW